MKTSSFSLVLFFAAIAIAVSSCDVVPDGLYYEDIQADTLVYDTRPDQNPDATAEKKVLLEEFTGHTCGNCPASSAIAHKLARETYKGKLIVATVHAGSLSVPEPGTGKFEIDYRTPEGNVLYANYNKVDAVPYALMNRIVRSGSNYLWPSAQWETKTQEMLQKAPEVRMLMAPSYNAATRAVSVKIDLKYLADVTTNAATENVSVYLVEDSIVSWQKDYRFADDLIKNYVHHDMVRKFLNGAYGQPVRPNAKPIFKQDRFYGIYNLTLPQAYNAATCKIVAFVHNTATREVRQVEEVEIQ